MDRKRWLVHGDLIEGQENLYYCRTCDLSFPREHFAEHENISGICPMFEKYRRDMKTWKLYQKLYPHKYYRPKNPENLFA